MNGKNAELLNRITVAPTVETTVNQDIWKAIQDALNKNHILQFDYTDRWGKQTEQRKLRPYQLVLDDGVCYLFGFDELRNAERIFFKKSIAVGGLPFELRDDTRSKRWDIYKNARNSIQKNNVPEMSLDEINAEIAAVRSGK